MSRKPPSSPAEILAMVLRRKWWIIVPLLTIPPLVFFTGSRLPKSYRSETVILVDPQKIPAEYVKATVTGDVADRLQNIREEVMSRTRLQRIADDLGLYPELRGKAKDDVLITAMRKDIVVELIRGANDRNPVGGFKISYTSFSPEMAQKVTQRIANLFIEENLQARGQQAQGTNEFIQSELLKAREALKQQEAKITAFKAAHFGSLPEQEASNLQLIGQLQSLAEANGQAMDRATQQRVYLQSMLNIGSGDRVEIARPLSPAQAELQTKRAQLNVAEQRYTSSHPDVIRLRSEVAMLDQEVQSEPKGKAAPLGPAGPNAAQQFESQLASIQQEIRMRTTRQAQLEGQIHNLQSRIAVVPAVQGQFADLNRDYEGLQKNYQSLIEKEQSSGMAAELELHEQSERFRILDPASRPSSPSSPNLLLINAAGLVGALLIGLALAFIIDMMDLTIHTPEECDRYLDIPLIATIPSIAACSTKTARRRWKSAV